jgi:hypothetical protein
MTDTIKTLLDGTGDNHGFVLAFVANPVLKTSMGSLYPDPACLSQASFDGAVDTFMQAILGLDPSMSEKLMAKTPLKNKVRVISLFVDNAPVAVENNLLGEQASLGSAADSYLIPYPGLAFDFLNTRELAADVVVVVSASTACYRSLSTYTQDDLQRTSVPYTIDAVSKSHGAFCNYPGVSAIHITAKPVTALHEFCHAASDFRAKIGDLYRIDSDLATRLIVNKKNTNGAVPQTFCTYNTVTFGVDQHNVTDGTTTTYHASPSVGTNLSLMDDYLSLSQPQIATLDQFTYSFLLDRLTIKVNRTISVSG